MNTPNDEDIDALLDAIEAEQTGSAPPAKSSGAAALAPIDLSPMSPDEAKQAAEALRREAAQRADAAATAISAGVTKAAGKVTGAFAGLSKRQAPAAEIIPTVTTRTSSAPAESRQGRPSEANVTQPILHESDFRNAADPNDDADLAIPPAQNTRASATSALPSTPAPAKRAASPQMIGGVIGALILIGGAGLWLTHTRSAPAAMSPVAHAPVKPSASPNAPAVPKPAAAAVPPVPVAPIPVPVPPPASPASPIGAPPPVATPTVSKPVPAPVLHAPPKHQLSTSGPKASAQTHAAWQDKADSAMDAYLKSQH